MELEINGQRAYAYTGGKVFDPALPCVVFIHGAANDHSVWSLQSRWFAHHGWSVLAVDLPGHGRSAGAPLPSIEALADWIGALLTKVGAGATASDAASGAIASAAAPRVALVGHSMGSLTALECAVRFPERVGRLALVGTAVPMPVSDALLRPARDNIARAVAMITAWSHSPRGALGGNAVPGMWLSGAGQRLMERQAPGVLHNDLAACNAYASGMNAAAALRCPTLVLSGSRDLMTSPKAAARLAEAIPVARRVTLDGVGHALMAENPDGVLDALRDFLASPP